MDLQDAYVKEQLRKLKYNYPDQAKKDIMNALVNFKDLKPIADLFVANTGEQKNRLCLNGTIPVNYCGATYNIPIRIWIRQNHPYSPPIPFVRPTETMKIKASRQVDQAGMVYSPYLHEWKPPVSDLCGLIQIMTIMFSEQPPVYACNTPQPRQSYPPAQYPRYPPPAPNPSTYPRQRTPYPAPYPQSQPSSRPPAPGGFMPMPTYPTASSNPPYPSGPGPVRSAAPYPTHTQSRPPYPSSGFPEPAPSGPVPPVTTTHPVPAASPVDVSGRQRSSDTNALGAPLADRQDSFELSAEQQRASLKSAVEDKLRRQLKHIWEKAENEMQSLHRTKEDLEQGSRKLNGMLETLDQKQKEVEENIQLMTSKDEEIRDALAKLESFAQNADVENIVVPAAPLYDQIFRLYAEENAIEDTIFYLTEGLRKGVVDVDVYLKHVRSLSRTQFQKRALMKKARQTAGLGEL